MGRVSSPAILVGHSYGGTSSLAREPTSALSGWFTSAHSLRTPTRRPKASRPNFRGTDVFSHIEVVDGRIWLRPEGTKCFCGDFGAGTETRLGDPGRAEAADLFDAESLGEPRGRSKPSWYIVGKNDQHCPSLIWSAFWQSGWAPPPMSSTVATCRCSRSLMWCSMLSVPRRARYRNAAARESTVACPALDSVIPSK